MYLVWLASTWFSTSSRLLTSARSLKNASAAFETISIALASAVARVMRAWASPSALRISRLLDSLGLEDRGLLDALPPRGCWRACRARPSSGATSPR